MKEIKVKINNDLPSYGRFNKFTDKSIELNLNAICRDKKDILIVIRHELLHYYIDLYKLRNEELVVTWIAENWDWISAESHKIFMNYIYPFLNKEENYNKFFKKE